MERTCAKGKLRRLENVRVGDEGGDAAFDGGGGTCEARTRGRASLP